MAGVRISVPSRARRGEIIDIKTLYSHPMETGYRRDALGVAIPRNIVSEFVCRFGAQTVFRAELNPGIAANPFFSFSMRADESGSLTFEWTDQHGNKTVEHRELVVET